MLEISTELDGELLKEKYMQKQSEKGFKFFGARRSEMNTRFGTIEALEEEAREGVREIRRIERERVEFALKICESLNSIERGKIGLLLEMGEKFRKKGEGEKAEVDYKKGV